MTARPTPLAQFTELATAANAARELARGLDQDGFAASHAAHVERELYRQAMAAGSDLLVKQPGPRRRPPARKKEG
jgi:hypothetical protein